LSDPIPENPLVQAEMLLRHRLRGWVWELRVLGHEAGVILQGQALNYHAKQLGQHIAIQEFRLMVVANEIEVRCDLPAKELNSPDSGWSNPSRAGPQLPRQATWPAHRDTGIPANGGGERDRSPLRFAREGTQQP
jgi:hypothetical protein